MKEAGGARKSKKKKTTTTKDITTTPNLTQNTKRNAAYFLFPRMHSLFVAPESARKIAAKNRSPMPTGIGGSFQLANSASPLGVIDSASAPTARIGEQTPWENRPQTHTA